MLFSLAVIAARPSSGAFCFRGNMRASFRHYPAFYSDGIKNTDHARRPLCNFRVIVPFAVPVSFAEDRGKAERPPRRENDLEFSGAATFKLA